MLLSTTPLSKIRPINPEQDSLVKTKLLIESMNRSPAKRSDFILTRDEKVHQYCNLTFNEIKASVVSSYQQSVLCVKRITHKERKDERSNDSQYTKTEATFIRLASLHHPIHLNSLQLI